MSWLFNQCFDLVVSSGSLPVSVREVSQGLTPPCSGLDGASLTDCLRWEPADASSGERWTCQRQKRRVLLWFTVVSAFNTCVFLHTPHPVTAAAATPPKTLLHFRNNVLRSHATNAALVLWANEIRSHPRAQEVEQKRLDRMKLWAWPLFPQNWQCSTVLSLWADPVKHVQGQLCVLSTPFVS